MYNIYIYISIYLYIMYIIQHLNSRSVVINCFNKIFDRLKVSLNDQP